MTYEVSSASSIFFFYDPVIISSFCKGVKWGLLSVV